MPRRPTSAAQLTPRLLTDEQAAAYLSIPVAEFLRLGVGRVAIGARVRYDIVALNAWLDEMRGVAPRIETHTEDDADAALARFDPDIRLVARRA